MFSLLADIQVEDVVWVLAAIALVLVIIYLVRRA